MENKILTFPLVEDESDCVCSKCRDLEFRLERSLKLHTQTACALAQAEALLVEARREIRRLQAEANPCN